MQNVMRMPRRGVIVAVGVALAVVSGFIAVLSGQNVTQAGESKPSGSASIRGSGQIFYTYAPDDVIRFTVSATADPYSHPYPGVPGMENGLPTDTRGTVSWSHWVPELGKTMTAQAAVDCMVTGGRTASVTAIVTKVNDPQLEDTIGDRVGFSIYVGSRQEDRLGFSWGIGNMDLDDNGVPTAGRTGTCMAPAPFAPVTQGDFTVHHVDLPPQASPTASPDSH